MTIDGIILRSIVEELNDKLLNGKVQKISQINKHLIILNIYNNNNYKLLLSTDSQAPRLHLTDKNFENPLNPSNFCMLLRKHLNNSRLISIEQNGLDRTVEFTFDCRNELGIPVNRKIYLDLMGKHSNLVLTDENNKVLDAITRVSHDMSRVRAIYPGTSFNMLKDEKIDILNNASNLSDLNIDGNINIFKIFYTYFTGFSPVIGREISYLAGLDPKRPFISLEEHEIDKLNRAFEFIKNLVISRNFSPNYIFTDEKLSNYYVFHLKHLGNNIKNNDSISEVLDNYFILNTKDDSLNQSKNAVIDQVNKIIIKRNHKLDLMNQDLKNAKDFDNYRIEGELLQANQHNINKGMKQITVLNYYTNKNLDIKLDERKSAWQNIELKYKQSKKLKRAYKMLIQNIPNIKDEIKYLVDIVRQLNSAQSHSDLHEIKQELHDGGYIRSVGKSKKKSKDQPSKPYKYQTDSGSLIIVGKNNKQNEQITLKDAGKDDIFLHIKDLPGSHVILKNNTSTYIEDDIIKAAYLAALHSKYSNEKYIDVDYTERKNVFKAKGAKPGMVYYNDFKTIRINLEENPEGYKIID